MEDAFWYGATHPNERIGLIAATYADARDTMVEGSSGLLSIVPAPCLFAWNRSLGELILWNGARYKLFAATEPERLRGPQHSRLYCDELAAWEYPETWDQAMFGLRLGQRPRTIIATTPKPTSLIRRIFADPHTHVTSGSTFDNAANLAPSALANLKAKYEGTRLGRQELNAEILDDVPGALWTRVMIDAARARCVLPDMARIVVAIDPSGARDADDEEADSIGIVVAGKGVDGRGYVLADRSCKLSPAAWGARAVDAYREFAADAIVAERNFGGAMVEHVIRTADPKAPYREVVASRGKIVRAEPVSALYEQGLVSHIGQMPELEDQMCNMGTAGYVGDGSPDRLDAMVWALTELMLGDQSGTQIIHVENLLLEGAPIHPPTHCQIVFCTVATSLKTGQPHDTLGAVFWSWDQNSSFPLTILDWDLSPIEGDWATRWVPSLAARLDVFARQYGAHYGTGGIWAEKRGSGVVVLEMANRQGLHACEIDTDLTKMGTQEKAAAVAGYVAANRIKMIAPAYEKSLLYKGVDRNQLLGQIRACRIGAKDAQPEEELLTAFLDGAMIACGNRSGW
jgi:phage terminase large subunit-like protein